MDQRYGVFSRDILQMKHETFLSLQLEKVSVRYQNDKEK